MSDRIAVKVYPKDLSGNGEALGEYESLSVTARHNLLGTGVLLVPSAQRLATTMSTTGARVVVTYDDEHVLSGPVRLVEARGAFLSKMLTFQVEDDWRLLRRLLGWQNPSGTLAQQNVRREMVYSGPAETVVKDMVSDAVGRLSGRHPYPITVAADQGRGSNITIQVRMNPMADRLLPVIDQAGIGVTVRQVGSGLVVDCYEPQAWPITLSEDAGTLTDVSWSRRPPEVTSVVVAIGGEGTAREYLGPYTNTTAEDDYGDVIEAHVDARDIATDDPAKATLAAARAAEVLAEGSEHYGLSISLSETDTFRYGGQGIHVGDTAPIALSTGVVVTDVVREATITENVESGLTVTPLVGERAGNDAALGRVLDSLARAVRTLRAGR